MKGYVFNANICIYEVKLQESHELEYQILKENTWIAFLIRQQIR